MFEEAAGRELRLEGVEKTDDSRFWRIAFPYSLGDSGISKLSRDFRQCVCVTAMASSWAYRAAYCSTRRELAKVRDPRHECPSALARRVCGSFAVCELETCAGVEPSDYELLIAQLNAFESVCTTPHVLAETSNFVDQAPPYRREDLLQLLRNFIRSSKEHYEAALSLSGLEEFDLLGLADAGLVSLSRKHVVVTTDFRLAGQIAKAGGLSVNLNHLRGNRLLWS